MMAPEAGAAGADQLANELAGALRAAGASGLAIKNWGLQSLRSCGRVAKAWYIHVCFETISKLEVLAQFKAFVVCSRLVLR